MRDARPGTDRLLDDLARFAGGAMTVMSGLTRQIREEIRSRVDEMATHMDLVPREDFDRLEAMLAASRREQADMSRRIAALEGKNKSAEEKYGSHGEIIPEKEDSAMRAGTSLHGEFNPIDHVEEVLSSNNWAFNRLGEDDLAVQLCGRSGVYKLSFHWDEENGILELVCGFDTPVSEANYAAAIKAILATNEKLWIGHVDLPSDTMTPVFRYAALFQGVPPASGSEQIDRMVRMTLDQCEGLYPLFALLASEAALDDDTIGLALSDAAGQS